MAIVVAAVIPDAAMIAATVPVAVTVITIMIMIVIVVMIAIVIVVMMVMTEPEEAPLVAPNESVVEIEIIIERRPEAVDADIVRPVTAPRVAAPIAVYPIVIVAVPVAIIEGTAIPLAVEIDRAIGDWIIPESVRTSPTVAIAPALVGKSYAAARAVAKAETVGAGGRTCEQRCPRQRQRRH